MLRPLAFTVFFASVVFGWIAMGMSAATAGISLWDGVTSLAACLVGWYIADALSGLVHMYMDYRPCTEGVGLGELFFYDGCRESEDYLSKRRLAMSKIGFFERVVFDFKNHHPRPMALGRRSFIYQTTSIMVFVFPLSVALDLATVFGALPIWLSMGLNVTLLGMIMSQYFHGALHRDDNPAIIGLMRRTGLLMTPAMHDIHHATLDRDFATNSGWSNPLINHVFNYFRRRGHMDPSGLEPR